MEHVIENHEWIQDEHRTKSALCFALSDLPEGLCDGLTSATFRATPEAWRVDLETTGAPHTLVFPAHPQLVEAQSRYDGLTLLGLDEAGAWKLQLWLDTPALQAA